ncbi:MAG: hypothetical protein DWQ01_21920 [Planctomycetota bacterium]|nr:MAG: hypothetical protein DWQ01_21920 [Planctomycetota bacterium]
MNRNRTPVRLPFLFLLLVVGLFWLKSWHDEQQAPLEPFQTDSQGQVSESEDALSKAAAGELESGHSGSSGEPSPGKRLDRGQAPELHLQLLDMSGRKALAGLAVRLLIAEGQGNELRGISDAQGTLQLNPPKVGLYRLEIHGGGAASAGYVETVELGPGFQEHLVKLPAPPSTLRLRAVDAESGETLVRARFALLPSRFVAASMHGVILEENLDYLPSQGGILEAPAPVYQHPMVLRVEAPGHLPVEVFQGQEVEFPLDLPLPREARQAFRLEGVFRGVRGAVLKWRFPTPRVMLPALAPGYRYEPGDRVRTEIRGQVILSAEGSGFLPVPGLDKGGPEQLFMEVRLASGRTFRLPAYPVPAVGGGLWKVPVEGSGLDAFAPPGD